MLGAGLPCGDGPIGTWDSLFRTESGGEVSGGETTIEQRDDGTGTLVQYESEPLEAEGSWGPDSANPGLFRFDVPFGGDSDFLVILFEVVDDVVTGFPLCRE